MKSAAACSDGRRLDGATGQGRIARGATRDLQCLMLPVEYFQNPKLATLRDDSSIATLIVDAEEDFDWQTPLRGAAYSTDCIKNIREFQEIIAVYGIVPAYLLTYPVLDDPVAICILQRYVERGKCAVGIQLHPWTTPPFGDDLGLTKSFSANLPAHLEEQKLARLIGKFVECFGQSPKIYRAGRYGLSRDTARLLETHGLTIDTSVAPRTDFRKEGGPDYSRYDYRPFWFGGQHSMLELPLCRSVVGWAGSSGAALYRAACRPVLNSIGVPRIVTGLHCAERITLSPEGNDLAAMRRLVRHLHAAGQRIFAVSFHSSSLAAGRNPYVRSTADLHEFYDRLSGILYHLAIEMNCRFVSTHDIPGLLVPPGPAL